MTRRGATTAGVFAALLLVASNQRTGLAGLSPLTGQMTADTGLSPAGIGLVSTITILVMGLLAPVIPRVSARIGGDRTLVLGLVTLAAGSLLRLVEPAMVTLFLGAMLVGAGITTIGTLLPGIIRKRFPDSAGSMTGWTTFALAFGSTVAASLAVPLADWLGWRASLAFWAVPALLAALFWWPLRSPQPTTANPAPALPWRSPTAWLVAGFLTLGTIGFFNCLAWVAPTYSDAGTGDEQAGLYMALLTAGNMAGALGGPTIGSRFADRRPVQVLAVAMAVAGALLLAVVAQLEITGMSLAAAVPPFLAGVGFGSAFGLSLLLLADAAATPHASRALSAMSFVVAFIAAAPFPTILGWLRDLTGSFSAGWILTAVLASLAALLGLRLGPSARGSVQ